MLRQLGRTGIQVSPICLGTMNFGGPTNEADAIRITHAAFDRGINFIDTANVYQRGESERIVGKRAATNHFTDLRATHPGTHEDALGVLEATLTAEELADFDELVPPGNAVADFHDSNNWMKARLVTG